MENKSIFRDEYAKQLLAVTESPGQSDHASPVAQAMARCSKVEPRIQLIPSTSQRLFQLTRWAAGRMVTLSCTSLLITVLLNPFSEATSTDAAVQDGSEPSVKNDHTVNKVVSNNPVVTWSPPSKSRFQIVSPDGRPSPDVLVRQMQHVPSFGPGELVSVRTDENGIAILTAIESAPVGHILVESSTYGKQTLRVDPEVKDAAQRCQLKETGSIKGRLVGDRPEWLRSVRVKFETDNQNIWHDTTKGIAEAVTDADGRFEVPVIAGGPLKVTVDFNPALPVRPLLDRSFFVKPGESTQIEISLVSATLVSGQIREKSGGKPVPNVMISLRNKSMPDFDQCMVTNEQGIFEGRVLPGLFDFECYSHSLPDGLVQLGGNFERATRIQVPAGVATYSLPPIDVVRTHRVGGQLVGKDDVPLSNTSVAAVHDNGIIDSDITDREGRFSLQVPDGLDTKINVATPLMAMPQPVETVSQDPLIIRYNADPTRETMERKRQEMADVVLTGRAMADGIPVVGVKLILIRSVPTIHSPKSIGYDKTSPAETETGVDGRFRIAGLKAHDLYRIDVKPPFINPRCSLISIVPGDARREFELPDLRLGKLTQSLAGTVVDKNGKPRNGVYVTARFLETLARIPNYSRSLPQTWTITDNEGRFRLTQLPDAPIAVSAAFDPARDVRDLPHNAFGVNLNQQDILIELDKSGSVRR